MRRKGNPSVDAHPFVGADLIWRRLLAARPYAKGGVQRPKPAVHIDTLKWLAEEVTLNPKPQTLNPHIDTLKWLAEEVTLNPKPQTLNPKPNLYALILNPKP